MSAQHLEAKRWDRSKEVNDLHCKRAGGLYATFLDARKDERDVAKAHIWKDSARYLDGVGSCSHGCAVIRVILCGGKRVVTEFNKA